MITLRADDPRVGEYSAGGELIRRPQRTLNNRPVQANDGTILYVGRYFVVVDAGLDTGALQVKIEPVPMSASADKEKKS